MTLLANTLLTTQVQVITKHRSFPIEIAGRGLVPLAKYNAFLDGINVNAFIKPYGKNLGDQIIADDRGQVKLLFLMNIEYNENFITTDTSQSVLNRNRVLELVDSSGLSSKTYIPIIQKPTG